MKFFRGLATAALLLCFGVVVMGGYVRLSDAGLGCPDWPGCYGRLVVPDAVQSGPSDRPLEHVKAWKEMAHRYLAGGLGALIVLMAFISRFSKSEAMPRTLPWVLGAFVIFQGLLGMWTVTLLLKPLVVTAHLLGGLATLALLCWLRLSMHSPSPHECGERVGVRGDPACAKAPLTPTLFPQEGRGGKNARPAGLRVLASVALALLAVQISLGGWTSSNYAALACPDLPTCQGQLWPELDLKEA
ncbi:MAG: COX15/CtaA family protein, partial [Nevskiales bacterium]|nr:COX15/CtaA family protein [Nevskiales bacterium]